MLMAKVERAQDAGWRAWVARGEKLAVRYGSAAICVAMLAAVLVELHRIDWATVSAMVPRQPVFWLLFAAFYCTQPVADWAIYRYIWQMPLAGLQQLFRKTISNDLLIGYAGEAYLYGCARRAGRGSGEALAALKDVSILSGAVGNSLTILVAIVALPELAALKVPHPGWPVIALLLAGLSLPIVAVACRGRLMHLPARDLRVIAALHAARAVLANVFTLLLWHLAMPDVAAQTWLALIAAKLLVSRLPLVSNKELVFATVALLLLGPGTQLAALMALLATMVTVTHVLLGLGLAIGTDGRGLWRTLRPRLATS